MGPSILVRQYAAAWSKTTRRDILSALENCWTSSSTYTDPITDTTAGPEGLASAILQFHDRFLGGTLAPASALDVHHCFGRFCWRLTTPSPTEVNGVVYGEETEGFDFVEFSPDGKKILKVVGFFGPLAM